MASARVALLQAKRDFGRKFERALMAPGGNDPAARFFALASSGGVPPAAVAQMLGADAIWAQVAAAPGPHPDAASRERMSAAIGGWLAISAQTQFGQWITDSSGTPSTVYAQWERRLQNTVSTCVRRRHVDADPRTTYTSPIFGARGSLGEARAQAAIAGTNIPVVLVTSRPGSDRPGTAPNCGISRGMTVGHSNADRGQVREVRLLGARRPQMRTANNVTAAFAAAPPPDPTADNQFDSFARPTLPLWLANWTPLMQQKRLEQTLAVAMVISPGTSFANLQAHVGDDRTVPCGGGALGLSRTKDGVRPGEVAIVFGPRSSAITAFYVSPDDSGQPRVRVNESIPGNDPGIVRTEGHSQTDPVGIVIQTEMQACWQSILSRSTRPVHATPWAPLAPDDIRCIRVQVKARLSPSERIAPPSRLVIRAGHIYNPAARRWELDRPVFDALVSQRPFAVLRALQGAPSEFARMKALMCKALETLRSELCERWAGMTTAQVLGDENSGEIRQIMRSLTPQDALRLRQLWRPSSQGAP